jgi:hypothetical protein
MPHGAAVGGTRAADRQQAIEGNGPWAQPRREQHLAGQRRPFAFPLATLAVSPAPSFAGGRRAAETWEQSEASDEAPAQHGGHPDSDNDGDHFAHYRDPLHDFGHIKHARRHHAGPL